MKLGVVNYNAGNLTSIEYALRFIGCDYFISSDPISLKKADKLLIPGVGEAGYAMNQLKKHQLDRLIIDEAKQKKPLFGICLGAQLFLTVSEEGNTPCLDLISGSVKEFKLSREYKVPHMGWNQVVYKEGNPLFRGIAQKTSFYFIHSYYMEPSDWNASAAVSEYGTEFVCALTQGHIYAAQFHPEKSGEAGLTLLRNFITI